MVIEPVVFTEVERFLLRKQRKVILCGEIDVCTVNDFITDMLILSDDSCDPITIIISSNGGTAEYGNGCIRAIREAQKKGIKVIGSVYGQAMSMAFIILQACDDRVMGELDTIMAHGLSVTSEGDMRNRESEDKLLKFFQNEYARLVANRCRKYNFNWWKKLLTDNTPRFFSSEESLKLGLVDRVE